ncbi:hypothetical protein ACU686_39525 [Yinghuangia aomiensis]
MVRLNTDSHSSISSAAPVRLGRRHEVPGRGLRLARRVPRHHRHRPAHRLRRGPDLAHAVDVRRQLAGLGELDDLQRLRPRLGEDPVRVRMVGQQLRHQFLDRPRRVVRLARLRQQPPQPVPLGIRPLGQPAEVDLDRVRRAHQPGQRRAAEGRVRVADLRGPLQMRDQAAQRGQRLLADLPVLRPHRGGLPAGGAEQGVGDRRGHLVERRQGHVDGVRPLLQVPGASQRTLLRGRVLPVVDGEFEVLQVRARVPAVHLQLAVDDARGAPRTRRCAPRRAGRPAVRRPTRRARRTPAGERS